MPSLQPPIIIWEIVIRIYLDHAATTPLHPAAREAMLLVLLGVALAGRMLAALLVARGLCFGLVRLCALRAVGPGDRIVINEGFGAFVDMSTIPAISSRFVARAVPPRSITSFFNSETNPSWLPSTSTPIPIDPLGNRPNQSK